jgi:glucan phosphorylase
MIASDFFSGGKPGLFQPTVNSLLDEGDRYTVLADFEAYVDCQWKGFPRLSRRRGLEPQVQFERGAHGTIFQ